MIGKLSNALSFLLLWLMSWTALCQDVLRYDLAGSSSWVPYYIEDSTKPGILGELIPYILSAANIVGVQINLPPKRTIIALEKGELDFDVVSPSWFENKNVGEHFVLSMPLFLIREHFIAVPSTLFNEENLLSQPIGTVRGYYYHDQAKFERIDFLSERDLVVALHKKRIDVAIVGDFPALYWSDYLSLPIKLGPLHSEGNLHIRLRKEQEFLITRINDAIDQLKRDGTIATIIEKYMGKAGLDSILPP